MTPKDTRPIERKSHTGQPGSQNDKCDCLIQHDKPNSPYRFTVLF